MFKKTGKTALIAAVVMLIASTIFVSCDNDIFGSNKPVDITLSSTLMQYSSFTEIEGQILQLEAKAILKSGAESRDILWDTPTDPTAFKIYSSANGKLVFEVLKSGTYKITASVSYGDSAIYKQATCIIKTNDELTVLGIRNDVTKTEYTAGATLEMVQGSTLLLSPVFTPEATTQTGVKWSTNTMDIIDLSVNSKTDVATVTAKSRGTAVITLTSTANPAVSTSLRINVQEDGSLQNAGPQQITLLTSGGTKVEVGKTSQVNATVLNSHSGTITDGTVEFSLDDNAENSFSLSVLSGRAANLTALRGGSGYLTALYRYTDNDGKEQSISSKLHFSVEGYLRGISTKSSYINIPKNSKEFIAVYYDPAETTQKGFDVSIEDETVAWVHSIEDDYSGFTLYAGKLGSTTVKVTSKADNTLSTTFNLRVVELVTDADRVSKVVINNPFMTVQPKDSYSGTGNAYNSVTLRADIYTTEDNGSQTMNDESYKLTFESSDSSIVAVTNSGFTSKNEGWYANLMPGRPGTAKITVRSVDNKEVYAVCTVTVEGELKKVIADRQSFNMTLGSVTTVELTPEPKNAVMTTPVVSVSNDVVDAEIRKKNSIYEVTVKALKVGSSTISYYSGSDCVATTHVTVTGTEMASARSLQFEGVSGSLYLKQDDAPVTFTVVPYDKTGSRLYKTVYFKSTDTKTVQVTDLKRNGNTNTFTLSPKNAGSGTWTFYLGDSSGVENRLYVEVGGSAVQGEKTARKLVAPSSSIALKVKGTQGQTTTVTLSTIPLGLEKEAGTVTWTTSGDCVKVTPKGKGTDSYTATIASLKEGSAVIKAETETGLTAEISVRVYSDETAVDTTITRAEISSGSSTGWGRWNSANSTFNLIATAYTKDGRAEGELFKWSCKGDTIAALNDISGKSAAASFRTVKTGSYANPSIITATSVSNPNVNAKFYVYVTSSEPKEDTPFVIADCSGITLSLDKGGKNSMDVSYTVYPSSYDSSALTVTTSSDAVKAVLNKTKGVLTITAEKAGTALVKVTDGKISFSVTATVVEKAEKIDGEINAIVLDRTYLSYDLADKDMQMITAYVYRGGVLDNTEKVKWMSLDEDIAEASAVPGSGNIAYIRTKDKKGTTGIVAYSASNPNIRAVCTVEIIDSRDIDAILRSINLSESSVSLSEGSYMYLTLTAQPDGVLEGSEVRWTSSDNSVASVTEDGRVTAVKAGQAKITVSVSKDNVTLERNCIVNVYSEDTGTTAVPSGIRLSETIMRVTQDDMDKDYVISAVVYDQNRKEIPGISVKWSVENTGSIITWSKSGLNFSFSPKNAGTAVVRASVGDIETEARIIVGVGRSSDTTLKSIVISAPGTIETGKTYTVTAYAVPADSEDNFVWTSSDKSSFRLIDSSNKGRTLTVKAVKDGAYTLTAKSVEKPEITAKAEIEAKTDVTAAEITGVSLDTRSVLLDLADKNMTVITATVYKGGKADASEKVKWTVDPSLSGVIAAEEKDGSIYIKKVKTGSGYITAASVSDKSKSAVCYVEVVDTSSTVMTSIHSAVISSSSLMLEKGNTHSLKVISYPSSLETAVDWTSSNESIVKVDTKGTVTAVAAGRAYVTAYVTGGTKTIAVSSTITVYDSVEEREDKVSVQRIEFDKTAVYLSQEKMDEAVSVTATVYGSDGQVYMNGGREAVVTWILKDSSVASMSYRENTAALTAKSAGMTSLTASYGGKTNSIPVATGSAVSKEPTGLSFTPSTLKLAKGGSATVTALVEPAGADAEYAYTVMEGTDVISINAAGKSVRVTGLKAGKAKLRAILVNKPEISAEIDIAVTENTSNAVTSITLDKTYITLTLDTKDLTTVSATAYVDGKASKNVPLKWSLEGLTSAELEYAVLDSCGSMVSLRKKAAGSGYLVCRAAGDENVYAKCRVDIVAPGTEIKTDPVEVAVKRIDLSSTYLTLSQEKMDEVYTVRAVVYGTDNRVMNTAVNWTVDSEDVIDYQTSDSEIRFTAKSAGTAVITANVGEVKSSAKVVVGSEYADTALKGYTLKPSATVLEVGSKMLLTLLTAPADAEADPLWTVDNSNVELIEENGKLYIAAKSAGTSVITATERTNPAIQAASTVKVVGKGEITAATITSVTLDKTNIVLDLADKKLTVLKAVVAKNYKASDAKVEWTVDESLGGAVSTVDMGANTIGIVKGTETGSGYITARSVDDGTFYARCYVEVIDSTAPAVIRMTGAVMSSDSVTMVEGDTLQLAVTAYPAAVRDDIAVEWTTGDVTVASVDEKGLVTAKAAGRTKISAAVTYGMQTVRAVCEVTVKSNGTTIEPGEVAVKRIDLSSTYLTLSQEKMDEVYTVRAVVYGTDNRVMNTAVNWTVDSEDVIDYQTSDSEIRFTAKSAGTAVITANVGEVKSSAKVVVGSEYADTALKGYTLKPSATVLEVGSKMLLTLLTAPADAEADPLWTVDNSNVELIEENGKLYIAAKSAGTSVITATERTNPAIQAASTVKVVGKGEITAATITSVTLDKTNIVLDLADKKLTVLKAVVAKNYKASDAKVEWTVDESLGGAVSTVDMGANTIGIVKGTETGSGYITARSVDDGTFYARCYVEVIDSTAPAVIRMTGAVMSSDSVTMVEGDTLQLAVTAYPAAVRDDIAVEWTTGDVTVASVDEKGLVTAKAAGRTKISAAVTYGMQTVRAVCEVNVRNYSVQLERIALSDESITLRVSEAYQMRWGFIPENAEGEITWKSSDAEIARVTDNGTIIGVAEGAAEITASVLKADGTVVSSSVDVTVVVNQGEVVPAFIRLSTYEIQLSQKEPDVNKTVTATVIATDGYPVSEAEVTWTLENDAVAIVEIDGNSISLLPGDAGKTTLKAWYGNLSASASVYTGVKPGSTVLDHLTTVPSDNVTIETGSSQNVSVRTYPVGLTITPKWESDDITVASLENDTAKTVVVKGEKHGKTVVTVSDTGTGKAAELNVRVLDDITNAITAVVLDKTALSFDLADKSLATVSATVYVNNTPATDGISIDWQLLEEDQETESGLVKFVPANTAKTKIAVAPAGTAGRAYLRATATNGIDTNYAQLFIEVVDSTTAPVKITELRCESDAATLPLGSSRRYSTITTPSDIEADIRWEIVSQHPEDGYANVLTMDAYGTVTGAGLGTALIKAYVYGSTPEVSDTMEITVIKIDETKPASRYEIGSILLNPARVTLEQDAAFPTEIKATVLDKNGNELKSEMVDWNTDGLTVDGEAVAKIVKTEGNTIYLEGLNAGKGELVASRTSSDGTVKSATAYIVTGGIVTYDEEHITGLSLNTSSPQYLVAGDGKKVESILKYIPASVKEQGVVWTAENAAGFISYSADNDGVTAVGIKATETGKDAVLRAVSVAKAEDGNAVTAEQAYRVVATAAELPAAVSLKLDRTAVVFNLAEKNTAVVSATAYDYNGNEVPTAVIKWSLEDVVDTDVTITQTTGAFTGVRRGTKVGTATLKASLMEGEEVVTAAECYISVIDSAVFEGISASAEELRLTVGGTASVTLYGTPSKMFKGAEASVSGTEGAVEVSTEDGKTFKVNALKEGTAVITYMTAAGGMEYTAKTTVYVSSADASGVDRISLAPSAVYLEKIGDSAELTAVVYDKKANVLAEEVVFSISDSTVAEIEETADGVKVTALKKGTTTITARCGNVSADAFVMVGEEYIVTPEDVLLKLIPSQNSIELKKNQVKDITVSAVPSSWNFENLAAVSDNTAVAEAEVEGSIIRISAVGEGTAAVTISEGDISAEVKVKVSGVASPAFVKFNKTDISLTQETGAEETVTAYVYDEDMVLLEKDIDLWQVGNPSVASIEENGNSVTVRPVNTGSTAVTASAGAVSSAFSVSVNEMAKTAAEPTAVKAGTANVKIETGTTAEIYVLYEPANLTEEGKAVKWTSADENIATVKALGSGRAAVYGVKPGKTTVTAESTVNGMAAVFSITVTNDAVYRIELDRTEIRLGFDAETVINAKLYNGENEIAADDVKWSLEGSWENCLAIMDGTEYKSAYTGASVVLRAKSGTAGYAYVTASYGGTTARAQVEITDTSKSGTGLTSVIVNPQYARCEVGETVSLTAETLPVTAGVVYTWNLLAEENEDERGKAEVVEMNGGTLTVEAVEKGYVNYQVKAVLPGYEAVVSDIVTIEICEEGTLDVIYRYGSVKLDKTTISMTPDGSYASINAVLYDTNGNKTEGALSGWNLLDSRGKTIFAWSGKDGVESWTYNGNSYASFNDLAKAEDGCPVSYMALIGEDNATIELAVSVSGTYFIEAVGPIEYEDRPENAVRARALITAGGNITGVGLSSSIMHMVLGETVSVNAAWTPAGAVVSSYKWEEAASDGVARLEFGDMYEQKADIKALAMGSTTLRYSAADTTGLYKSAEMAITVHDKGYGAGGIRTLAFDNTYATASYPYSTEVYKAKVYYMDGTSAEDDDIVYSFYHADGTSILDGEDGIERSVIYQSIEDGSPAGTAVVNYAVTDGGIRITPVGPGMIRITAVMQKDDGSPEYSASMWLTVTGDTVTVTPSASAVTLYTGGSAEIELSTENNINTSYKVELVEEYTNDGYRIINGTVEGKDEKMPSVFTAETTGTKSGRSIVLGTKSLVPESTFKSVKSDDEKVKPELVNISKSVSDFYLLAEGDTISRGEWQKISSSFPRTATFKVSTTDGQSSAYISVTVNELPSGNSYPVSISLNSDKLDLTPPFSSDQTTTATLTDASGAATKGTVKWYWYPVGMRWDYLDEDTKAEAYRLDTTGKVEDNDMVEAYFSPDTTTMYYKPKRSGLYRLTVRCVQNPQLEYTATLSIGGAVTGVKANTGTSVSVEKGESVDITAEFTPASALARHAYFALTEEVTAEGGNAKKYMNVINDVTYDGNPYVNLTINKGEETGDTVTVFGKMKTGSTPQLLTTLYPQTTSDESKMTAALESGEKIYWTLSGNTMKAWKAVDGRIEAYQTVENGSLKNVEIKVFTYQTTITVTNPTTVYSFKVAGETSINPSAVTGNKLSYTVSAASGSSGESFSSWGWVEAKLIGEDSGQVYASSVPVNAAGESLYQWTDADGNVSSKWYTADEIKALNAGGAADGVSASGLRNYNASAVVYRYFTGTDLSALEKAEADTAILRTDETGTKYYNMDGSLFDSYSMVYDVQKADDGTYFYYYAGRETEVSFEDNGDAEKGSLAAVLIPLKLSNLSNGKLVAEDNNQTYSFILNTNAIPEEPLLFEVGISDRVERNNDNSEYYDNEANVFLPSDQRLYIGGEIQTLTAGTSVVSNNGKAQTSESIEGSMLTLIEGASAVLNLSYNPEYTHQKEVTWSIIGENGKMTTNEYSAIPAADSSSLTFIAYKLASGQTKTVTVRATSVYNSKIYCDYTIVIHCVVKNMEFTSKALMQVNSLDRSAEPLYKLKSDPNYPDQTSDNTIDCYDYSDIAGDSAAVDAYLIEMKPTPKYGYTFKAELIEGSAVGSLNTANLDEGSNSFRFVPIGRVYDEYDENGKAASLSYTVNYGDAIVRVTCEDLNYSKDFTINYGAASGRLVREIENPKENDNWKLWDTATVDGKHYLYGLETVVMYEGESFPLTIIDFNNGQGGGDFFKHWSEDENMKANSAMMWYVEDSNGNVCTDGSVYYDYNAKGEALAVSEGTKQEGKNLWLDEDGTYNWNGGLKFKAEGGRDNASYTQPDPRVIYDESTGRVTQGSGDAYTGLFGTVCTLTAEKQGIYTLYYTYISVLTDDKGEPQVDTNGVYAHVVTTGSVKVYVISKASQSLVGAVNELYTDGAAPFGLIAGEISRSNLDKWFLPSAKSSLNRNETGAELYRGRTYLVFDYTHEYSGDGSGESYTGLRELSSTTGILDFTNLRQTAFDNGFAGTNYIKTDSLTITGMKTSAKNENEKYTKVFAGVRFEDLILTGENGIALLDGYNQFVVGPYKGETENDGNIDEGNWLYNNISVMNGKKILDFSASTIKSLTLKNLDLTPVEGILLRESVDETDTLKEFGMINCIYPKAVFMDGDVSRLWSDETKAKYLRRLSFKDTLIQNINLKNCPTLEKLTVNGRSVGCDTSRSGFNWNLSGIFLTDVGSTLLDLDIDKNTNLLFSKIHIKGLTYEPDTKNFSEHLSSIVLANLVHVEEVILDGVYSDGEVTVTGGNLKRVSLDRVHSGGEMTLKTGTEADPLAIKNIEAESITVGSAKAGTDDKPVGFGRISIDGAVTKSVSLSATGISPTTEIVLSSLSSEKDTDVAFKSFDKLRKVEVSDSPSLHAVAFNRAGGADTEVVIRSSGAGTGIKVSGTAYNGSIGVLTLENGVKLAADGGSINLPVRKIVFNGVQADGGNSSAAVITFSKKDQLEELVIGAVEKEKACQSSIGTIDLKNTKLKSLIFGGTVKATEIKTVDYSNTTVSTADGIISCFNESINGGGINVHSFSFNGSTVTDRDFKTAVRTIGSRAGDEITAKTAVIVISGSSLNLSGGLPSTSTVTDKVPDGEESVTDIYFTEIFGSGDTAEEAAADAGEAKSWTCCATVKQVAVESFQLSGLCTSACRSSTAVIDGRELTVHCHHNGGVFFIEKNAEGVEFVSAVEPYEEKSFSYFQAGQTTVLTREDEEGYQESIVKNRYSHGIMIEHIGSDINPNHSDEDDSDGCILALTFPDGTRHFFVQKMIKSTNHDYYPSELNWHADSADHGASDNWPPAGSEKDKTETVQLEGKYFVSRNWYIAQVKETDTDQYVDALVNTWLRDRGYDTLENSYKKTRDILLESTVTPKYKEVKRTVTSAAASSGDRCWGIDISGARFKTVTGGALTKVDSPILIVSMKNLKSLKANNCDLINASISSQCSSLTCLEAACNRFGADNGWICIGYNTYERKTVRTCDAVVDWSTWGGTSSRGEEYMPALESGSVDLHGNGICIIVDYDNRPSYLWTDGFNYKDVNENSAAGQTVKVKIGTNADIVKAVGEKTKFLYCCHQIQTSNMRGSWLSSAESWDVGTFNYTVKVADLAIYSNNSSVPMPDGWSRWVNSFDQNPDSALKAADETMLNSNIKTALRQAGYDTESLEGKGVTVRINSGKRSFSGNHHYTKTWVYPFGDSELFRTELSDWSWGNGKKLVFSSSR